MSTEEVIVNSGRPMDKERVELVIQALAAFQDHKDAIKWLEAKGYKTTELKLRHLAAKHMEEIQERKGQLAPVLEAALANDMLDNARMATVVERMAIKLARRHLREGKVSDPARVARDLSQLRTQSIDKRLALQGRPTTISASVDVDGLIKQLENMGVAKRADVESSAVELEATGDGR